MSSIAQISDISIVSAHCEQFIKYECKGSLLFCPDDPTAWWVSRNGIQLLYWGGGGGASPVDFKKCACGATSPGTCVDSSYICNCYANIDRSWLGDTGYLTEIVFL